MKTIYQYLAVAFLAFAFGACSEEEVSTFNSERGVNFVIYNAYYDSYEDDYENLESEYNFYTDYSTQASMTLQPCSVQVGVQLEGTFSDQPVRIKVKAEAVEGYETPEVTLPEEIIIPANEYQANFTVLCSQPKEYEKEYKVKLVFDYANSDVVAGTKERQEYIVTVSDQTLWEDMYVENAEGWSSTYSSTLGAYGPVKIRYIFMIMAKNYQESYNSVRVTYLYTKSGGNYNMWYGFLGIMDLMEEDLAAYNATLASPLCEPDGTPVAF